MPALHFAVFLFGLAGLFGKFIGLPAIVIVAGRTLFASITLLAILLILQRKTLTRQALGPGRLGVLALSGAILAFHWWAFFHSIRISTVAVGLLSFSSFPLFVTFLEPLFFRERLKASDLLSAGAVVAGLALLVPSFSLRNATTQGVCWGVASGFTFALLTLTNRHVAKTTPPLVVALFQDGFAFLFLLPFLAAAPPAISGQQLLLLMVLGVFCTALAHTLFIRSLTAVRAQTAAVVSSLEPVYGIIFALLLLHEVPAVRTVAGGLIILSTTVWVTVRHRPFSP
jgi:drug/metabolite transporter (DMT)-like permease